MKLIVLTSPDAVEGEVAIIHGMMEDGLEFLHLRKPAYTRQEMESEVREIHPAFRKRIVLHSHHDLAVEFGLLGAHGSGKLPASVRHSRSFHSIREIQECTVPYAYVFLSPVFDSISKPGYRSAFRREDLREFLRGTDRQVIALGGVDEGHVDIVRDLGFSGAAVLGAVWRSTDPIRSFRRLREKCA